MPHPDGGARGPQATQQRGRSELNGRGAKETLRVLRLEDGRTGIQVHLVQMQVCMRPGR